MQREKGRDMAAEGEQAPPRRRTKANLNQGTGDPNTIDLTSLRGREKTTNAPRTDGLGLDEGLTDPRRPNTNVARYGPLATTPTQRTTQPGPTPIPPRQQALTRDLPPPRQARPTRNLTMEPALRTTPRKQGQKNMHWLFLIGIGMTIALVLWVVASLALGWGTRLYNDFHYGNPRTSHADAIVGHGGDSQAHPSHFIAMNWNHQAVVIEFKAGDPGKSVSYVAPVYIVGDDGTAPVTLEFRDVNGDKKVDMIIHIHVPSQDQVSVFINDGDKFRPQTNDDNIHL